MSKDSFYHVGTFRSAFTGMLHFLCLALLLLIASCNKETSAPENTLQAYIDEHPEWQPHDELVACAAGGQQGFLDDANAPLSMFFYPKLYSTNFRYYETRDGEANPDDLAKFVEMEANFEPLFNGFMARFPLPEPGSDRWACVSYVSQDTLWYCKPVRYKMQSKPTIFSTDRMEITLENDITPLITWEDQDPENIIYFQILVDERGDAISATYTEEKAFKFYDTSNVVFNVTRPGPVLPLLPNKDYSVILMGISGDNWVNLIAQGSFITGG
ncbi:MAG: hypothetical protein HKN87_04110 [Saprospiraceae bacterium]|nr:hypothetical protein [Saprospiraceae bacterium]